MRSANDIDRAFEEGMDALRRAVLAALSPRAVLQPVDDFDPLLVGEAGPHVAEPRDVALGHVHAAAAADVDHRRPRHGERVRAVFGHQPDARIHARLEPEAGIGHFDLDAGRPRGRVEHRRHAAHLAGEPLAGERVHFDERLGLFGVEEIATPGYTLVSAEISYTVPGDRNTPSMTIGLKGENLADDEVLNSASFKRREGVLEPGASVRLFGSISLN